VRHTVYFQRIGPANFSYAWLLSLGSRVVAWKIELPPALARRFERFAAYDELARDEKLALQEECFEVWRSKLLPRLVERTRCSAVLDGRTIDFSRNVLQHYGVEFEQVFLLARAAQRQHDRSGTPWHVACAWPLASLGRAVLDDCLPAGALHHSRLNARLDALHAWFAAGRHWLSGLVKYVRCVGSSRARPAERGELFWRGISPDEVPETDHRLNCGWAVQYSRAAPPDSLYFLPRRSTPAQQKYLQRHGLKYVEPGGEYGRAGILDGLHALWRSAVEFGRGIVADEPAIGALRASFAARAFIWSKVVRRCAPRACLTTTSDSWPEAPEVAVLKAHGVKSVIWSYSANSLRFASHYREFRDVSVERSILIADEFWVWNDAFREWLERRQLPVNGKSIAVVKQGAMMCGDAAHLQRAPADARRMLGLEPRRPVISVFDVSAVSEAWQRRNLGISPRMELEYAEAFFAGIATVMERFPGITIALKLKRSLSDRSRAYPRSLLELVRPDRRWLAEGRLTLLDPGIDPYLPIAVGDAAIGMAFTSPVLLSIASGRGGIYFDPLELAASPAERAYLALTVQRVEDLIDRVDAWVNRSQPPRELPLERLLPRLDAVDFSRVG
jgi:hypothetical protein